MAGATEQVVGGGPLLETKLYVPKRRPGLVSRPRLLERLSSGRDGKLTLISAPPGFGKTTLLADWLSTFQAGERVAGWVQLDPGDNDPALFWAYVLTAVQRAAIEVGAGALALLRSPQPPPIESILTALINELHGIEGDITLVLDDLHVIESHPIHEALAFLLDHLPPQLNLVIASRSDPPLQLPRLRARGELTELRAADLRFTPDEAGAFLGDVMGLELSAEDVAALETRTEGWIAGLQLAALSMRGRSDVSGFIEAFAGDARYIVDYLAEEVLRRQPEHVRSFLLQTSILDRLSGPLCDAVTGRNDGTRMLEALERGNLFVVPLDDSRRWYRYHHLFADVLLARLPEELPGQAPLLHCRASEWYEQNGEPAVAIRHAFAGGNPERAASLIELSATAMRSARQEATLLAWLKQLPGALFHTRPVLNSVFASVAMSCGELEGVEERLREVEHWLESPSGETVVVDHDELRRLPGSIAVHSSGLAMAMGDLDGAVRYARRALDITAEDDFFYRGAALSLIGLVAWARGDLEEAHSSYGEGMTSLRRAGFVADSIGGVTSLADIRIVQGRLRDAMRTYEDSLKLANAQRGIVPRGTADMYRGMAEILCERNDLDGALRHLQTSRDLGEAAGFPAHPYRWRATMASVREAQGDIIGALDLLTEAEGVYVSDFHPDVRPLSTQKARLWIMQGKLDQADAWAHKRGISAADNLSYVREFEHITLARLLTTRYERDRDDRSIQEAIALLERLLAAAEEGTRAGSVIEILVALALAYRAAGDMSRALASLERALTLAEPESYVWIFTGEGDAMRELLRQATATDYSRRLLSTFGEPAMTGPAPTKPVTFELPEPLTAREIEIVRLIAAGLRNEEIAGQLYISLATVKRHIANAYGKLGVTHRVEAVNRSTDLGLL